MPSYLVDENLPYYFSVWNNEAYIHQRDINDEWDDNKIWNYALEQNLTIITKDSDFSTRIMLHNPPPPVIHIRSGNLKMKDFFLRISQCWEDVTSMSRSHKLVSMIGLKLLIKFNGDY